MLRCAITDGSFHPREGAEASQRLARRCAALARDGVELLIVREKQLEAGHLTALAAALVDAVRGHRMKVLVAQRADVAIAAAAHGVHLSGSPGELTPRQVRLVMPGAFVSVSCHQPEEVRRVAESGADVILFAPVFGKSSAGEKFRSGVGLEKLHGACQAARRVPVLALGAVTAENAPDCMAMGAAGVAGIRLFFG